MKLIDKDALVAEIRKRFDEYSNSILKHYDACKEAKAQELGKILIILDTLEVKEVDLEKELDYNDYISFFEEHPDYNNRDWGFDECWVFAKHFFELGLKAQHDNWKVVDNKED